MALVAKELCAIAGACDPVVASVSPIGDSFCGWVRAGSWAELGGIATLDR